LAYRSALLIACRAVPRKRGLEPRSPRDTPGFCLRSCSGVAASMSRSRRRWKALIREPTPSTGTIPATRRASTDIGAIEATPRRVPEARDSFPEAVLTSGRRFGPGPAAKPLAHSDGTRRRLIVPRSWPLFPSSASSPTAAGRVLSDVLFASRRARGFAVQAATWNARSIWRVPRSP